MKSRYKRLGDFIHKIDVRNKNSQNTKLLGLSMTKEFRPHASNIIGTDLSRYKVVDQWQFACDFMSTIRVRKLPVVLQDKDEQIIVSPAYTTFEVIDPNELHPEYLMMWFRRSEFDRYAYFCCDSAVRGGFNWNELCDVELPVPSIEKQREIVKEYNTVINRKRLKEKLNQTLEETAQALYKHWFVDFEFPNEERQPYKSSGGKMVYSEKLDQEIPEDWCAKPVYEIAEFVNGASFKSEDFCSNQDGLPIIKIAELKKGVHNNTNYTNVAKRDKFKIEDGSLLYSWSGTPDTSLQVFKWFGGEAWLNQHIFKINFNTVQNEYFIYYTMKMLKPVFVKLAEGKQTTGLGHITVSDMKELHIPFPSIRVMSLVSIIFGKFYKHDSILANELIHLQDFEDLILRGISTKNSDQIEQTA